MRSPPPFVVIGNPESRRVAGFAAALARRGLPPARLVPYTDLLAGRVCLAEVIPAGALLRIESPDTSWPVEQAILARGAGAADPEGSDAYARAPRAAIQALACDPGAIRYPRQWYLGWCALLTELAAVLPAVPGARWLNPPADIACMFDKRACHARLAAAGIPLPRALAPPNSYAELLAALDAAGRDRVFVKPAHGSSASGVVAYQRAGARHQATTTVELVAGPDGVRLYNSRRVRVYRDQREIAVLLDALCRHRVHVEQWVPKAGLHGQVIDLRVLMISGQVRHTVVRLSRGPLTNLHLGNDRAGIAALLPRLGADAWAAAQATCARVAAAFPASLYLGIDLLITADYRAHVVGEVNAFGDLLYHTLDAGQDPYDAEIAALLGQEADREPATTTGRKRRP
jgi:hypothetical protein